MRKSSWDFSFNLKFRGEQNGKKSVERTTGVDDKHHLVIMGTSPLLTINVP